MLFGIASLFLISIALSGVDSAAPQTRVRTFGTWPDKGSCNMEFGAGPDWQKLNQPGAPCKETNAIYVPFGYSATLCAEHALGPKVRCRSFMPGTYTLDATFRRIANTIKVTPGMRGYLGSENFDSDWKPDVTDSNYSPATTRFRPSSDTSFGSSGDYVIQHYVFETPSRESCPNPEFAQTAISGAGFTTHDSGDKRIVEVVLWVRIKHKETPNNSVAVTMTCGGDGTFSSSSGGE